MSSLLTICTWALSPPTLLFYLFLLLDEWRIPVRARVAVTALSFFVAIAALAPVRPPYYYIVMPVLFLTLFLVALYCSATRSFRFLFLFLSALLFTVLSAILSGGLGAHFGVPTLVFHLPVDGVMAFVCLRFFRPSFQSIHRVVPRRWEPLLAVPLCSILALYLLSYRFLNSTLALGGLLFLVLGIYGLFSVFFRTLHRRYEGVMDSVMLQSQYQTLSDLAAGQRTREHRWRILRHDLRHYTPPSGQQPEAWRHPQRNRNHCGYAQPAVP